MFAQRLKQLRKQKKLTQTELANELNLSHGAIAMWETDKRQPDNETLIRLADFFGVSVDYLLGRSEEKTPPDDDLSEGEKKLVELATYLTDEEREEIIKYIDYLVSKR